MTFTYIDYLIIFFFLGLLLWMLLKSLKKEIAYPDYFNAGGKLHWFWIGASLLGTNIQIEYILGSAAKGFTDGLAYGSYEWTASFVLIFCALYIYPYFLRAGIITLPEYLEYRFSKNFRIIMGIFFLLLNFGMIILILNSSAIFIEKIFGFNKIITVTTVACTGGILIGAGGMKLKLRIDFIVILFFLTAGSLLLILCFIKTEGVNNFYLLSSNKLEVILPATDPHLPWTSVFLGGLWVNHLFYWAFFQPITQGPLASDSLSHTQKGLLFAASIKLLLPFIMIIPGIVGYELYANSISHPDFTLPVVIANVVPSGLAGLIIIGYAGTLFTTYNGFLNATTTIFSLDIFNKIRPFSSGKELIRSARFFIPVFLIASILCASLFDPSDLLFHYSQLLLVSTAPVNTSIFLFAIFSKRTPPIAAYLSLAFGIPLFFILKYFTDTSLLNLSGIVFLTLCTLMYAIRFLSPLKNPVVMPEKHEIKFERNLSVVIWGIFLVSLVGAIYFIFI